MAWGKENSGGRAQVCADALSPGGERSGPAAGGPPTGCSTPGGGMRSRPGARGCQEILCLPAGQVTTWRSQSTTNCDLSKPVPSRACHPGSSATGPTIVTPYWRAFDSCATRRDDEMDGKSHRLSRQTMSPWTVASGGCTPEVKQLALKGTGVARCRPPRSRAWLRVVYLQRADNWSGPIRSR
jgi:hypothetical protein